MSKADKIDLLSKAAAFAIRRGQPEKAKQLRLLILRMLRNKS